MVHDDMRDYTPYKSLSCLFYDTVKGYASAAEIQAYTQLMSSSTEHILEAMCGSGRLMIPLIRQGYIVHGVDTSASMLERCTQRSRALGIPIVTFTQSLQELKLTHRYDAITIAVGSFQLITHEPDAVTALVRLKQHLKPQGVILIDTFMPDLQVTRLDPRKAVLGPDEYIMLYSRYVHEHNCQVIQALNQYELVKQGVIMHTEYEILPIVWRTQEQWRNLCTQAGLAIIDFYPTSFRPALQSAIMKLTAQN